MTDATVRRRTGRPPRTSREQILDAAALFDPVNLQLTTLAEQLGISVKTVYYYFPNRAALIGGLTDRMVDALPLPDVTRCATAREVLTEAARWSYRAAETQPDWFFDVAAPRGAGVRLIGDVFARLGELGSDDVTCLRAFVVVTNYAFAAGQGARRTREAGGLSRSNVDRHLADYADPESGRRIAAAMADLSVDELFEEGLAVVLSGVERELLKD